MTKTLLLSFDIEENFQAENLRAAFPPESWSSQPRRTALLVPRILERLDRSGLRATFFFLGWVAERHSDMVRDVARAGHEVASHGYGHIMPVEMPPAAFREDVRRAKRLLEDLTGSPVNGYRAPNFSIDDARLDILFDEGYQYDSSYHPFGLHDRYGVLGHVGDLVSPGLYRVRPGRFEFVVPVLKLAGLPIPLSGGGYFRLYPLSLTTLLISAYLRRHDFMPLYFHPWEFDPEQPRASGVSRWKRFRHYVHIAGNDRKLEAFLGVMKARGISFGRYDDFLKPFLLY